MIDFLSNRLLKNVFANIDQHSLELINKTFAGKAKLRGESDVIWKAKISGQKGYIYLHCKHQSKVSRPLYAFKIIKIQRPVNAATSERI